MSKTESKYDLGDNVWADTVAGESIHISAAKSGKKGYYCKGCKKEMQAVKAQIQYRMSYFRHDAVAVKGDKKCTYSDETYRHKLAKELLLLLKHIKVPAVYKYPPKGVDGLKFLIKEAELIEAYYVRTEQTFYEDEEGNITWGSNKNVAEKHLLLKPDAVFFDNVDKPILFVEFVATHNINGPKLAKLRRLGINTIQVRVPKDSREAIEQSFYTTERTKWIYNYEEANSDYVKVSSGNSEGILPSDEDQRRLFTENFNCRQSQINNLIRRIKQVLDSKHYGDTEQGFRDELLRVKGNTEERRSELDRLREEHRGAVLERFKTQMEEFERERERIEGEEGDFQGYFKDLERRYKSKKLSLEREEKKVDRELSGEIEDETGDGDSIANRRRADKRNKDELQYLIGEAESKIAIIEEEEAGLSDGNKKLRESIVQRFEQLTGTEKWEIERIEKEQGELPEKFASEEASLPGEFETEEKRLEAEFEGLRRQADEAVKSRSGVGNTELHQRIRRLLEAWNLLNDIKQVQFHNKRNRTAWECFKSSAYENWV